MAARGPNYRPNGGAAHCPLLLLISICPSSDCPFGLAFFFFLLFCCPSFLFERFEHAFFRRLRFAGLQLFFDSCLCGPCEGGKQRPGGEDRSGHRGSTISTAAAGGGACTATHTHVNSHAGTQLWWWRLHVRRKPSAHPFRPLAPWQAIPTTLACSARYCARSGLRRGTRRRRRPFSFVVLQHGAVPPCRGAPAEVCGRARSAGTICRQIPSRHLLIGPRHAVRPCAATGGAALTSAAPPPAGPTTGRPTGRPTGLQL